MLSSDHKRNLKKQAHSLKPVVQVGQKGVTEGLHREIDRALLAHELIKVRMMEQESPKELAAHLADENGAEVVAIVGHTVMLFRRNPDAPKIKIS